MRNSFRARWLRCLLMCLGYANAVFAQFPSFEQIFEQQGVVMLLIEPESGRIVDANPAAVAFYGHSRERLRGMAIQQINTLSSEQVAEERALAAKQGRNYFIFRHRLADGEIRSVEVYSHPFAVDGRSLLLSLIHDITPGRNLEQGIWHYQKRLEELVEIQSAEAIAREQQLRHWLTATLVVLSLLTLALALAMYRRRRVEARLHRFSRDFHAFLDQTTDFIYFKDAQSRIRFCSQPLARITGHCNWREMIGKHDRDIFPADTARVYEEEEQGIFAGGQSVLNKVNPYYDADGHLGYVQTNKWPLFDAQGGVCGVFGISRDITEQRLFEHTLSAMNGDLARLTSAEFFRAACRLLCETLGTDIAFVGQLEDGQEQIQVIEGWADNQPLTPFSYLLADTPCADVMKKGTACYPENVQALFPGDH
ncbi:MAG: PAS domain S-box protein, partial [Gammaproteobacteria bacterium]|nr:PAS domain S-box protein [Gammaproteobacteria bacterium]